MSETALRGLEASVFRASIYVAEASVIVHSQSLGLRREDHDVLVELLNDAMLHLGSVTRMLHPDFPASDNDSLAAWVSPRLRMYKPDLREGLTGAARFDAITTDAWTELAELVSISKRRGLAEGNLEPSWELACAWSHVSQARYVLDPHSLLDVLNARYPDTSMDRLVASMQDEIEEFRARVRRRGRRGCRRL